MAQKKKRPSAAKKPAPAKKPTSHRSFRLSPRARDAKSTVSIPSGRALLADSVRLLWQGKGLIAGLVLIHSVLIVLLALDAASETSPLYSLLLVIIVSMAEVWVIRQLAAAESIAMGP